MSTLISSDIELQVGGDRLSVTGTDSALVARAESIWALLRIRKGLPRTPKPFQDSPTTPDIASLLEPSPGSV